MLIKRRRGKKERMKGDEARQLLGFSPDCRPTLPQIKEAYRRKVWECHPDLFQSLHQKPLAESNFKLISEAYALLLSGGRGEASASGAYSRVVKHGFARGSGGKSKALIKLPFLLLVMGTAALGALNATRAYRKGKQAYPSHNPFLP